MLAENIVKLNNNKIFDEIQRFLDKKYLISESDNTRVGYEKDIRQFFEYLTKGKKEIEHLTIEDVQLSQDDIEDYQIYLVKLNKYANSTINRKIAPIKELYKRFKRRGIVESTSMFEDVKGLKVTEEDSSRPLTEDELYEILNFVKERPRGKKNLILYYLCKFSVDTRARIDECLSVKWSNFEGSGDSINIKMVGKGNKLFKPSISKRFYDELLVLRKDGEDKVFDVSLNAVNDMMNAIRECVDFPNKEAIKFHSFRKTGGTWVYQTTKDLEYTRKALNHSSIETTQRYIESIDYGIQGMFSMSDSCDEDLYKKVKLDQLIAAIDRLDHAERMRINIKLNEINTK